MTISNLEIFPLLKPKKKEVTEKDRKLLVNSGVTSQIFFMKPKFKTLLGSFRQWIRLIDTLISCSFLSP